MLVNGKSRACAQLAKRSPRRTVAPITGRQRGGGSVSGQALADSNQAPAPGTRAGLGPEPPWSLFQVSLQGDGKPVCSVMDFYRCACPCSRPPLRGRAEHPSPPQPRRRACLGLLPKRKSSRAGFPVVVGCPVKELSGTPGPGEQETHQDSMLLTAPQPGTGLWGEPHPQRLC